MKLIPMKVVESLRYIFTAEIFRPELQIHMTGVAEYVIAFQGHPRSMIFRSVEGLMQWTL